MVNFEIIRSFSASTLHYLVAFESRMSLLPSDKHKTSLLAYPLRM